MTTQILLQGNNLIFILPFALGLMYLGLYTCTGLTFGETDSDASGDHAFGGHFEIEHDIDAHLDVDQDTSFEHDVETDGHETEGNQTGGSAFFSALNWIGIGRMPLSLVLLVLMLSWGTIGFCANQLQAGQAADHALAVSIVAAAAGAILITHFISAAAGRTIFATHNIARRRHELLGSLADALYPIDAKFGMACGRDDRGELFQVACRIHEGKQPIEKGSAVQLVGYTAKERMFYVTPAQSAKTPRR